MEEGVVIGELVFQRKTDWKWSVGDAIVMVS